MKLDELDLRLLRELEIDPRLGVHALSMKLGAKRTTVDNRLKRLIDDQIVEVTAVANRVLLGYNFLFAIGINVNSGKSEVVAEQLIPLDSAKAIVLATGRYNIVVWAIARNASEFVNFLSGDVGGIPDVAGIETFHMFHMLKNTWNYFTPENNEAGFWEHVPVTEPLSELDLSMIRELELDPRQNMTQLAANVNSSRWTVTKRFQKLQNDKTIRFVSLVDPLALGYHVRVLLLVKVKPSEIHTVAYRLSRHIHTMNTSLVFGDFQILVMATFRDVLQLHAFLNEEIERMPEVVRYEIISLVKWIKYTTKMLS